MDQNEQLHLLQAAVEQSFNALLVTDADLNEGPFIVYANPAFERQTGYSWQELEGNTPRILQGPATDEEILNRLQRTMEDGQHFQDQATIYRRDGTPYEVQWLISPVRDPETGAITHFVSVQQDISDRVRMERELERVATTDWLTGLANRRRFEELLDKEIERSQRYHHDLALVMFDVDYFKAVNDRYGHAVGDEILKALTETVAKSLRSADEFGRWGGEEFMILAPETQGEEGRELAERLQLTLANTEFPGPGHITASFGVTAWRPDDTPREITRRVDEALYEAKNKGRDRVETI